MSSSASARRGSQKPRVLTRPAFVTEAAGLEAIELAHVCGLHLDPWQQLIVRVALAERADGKYSAREVAELVARQNGKGGALEAIVLHGMVLVRDPLTLWTAHQTKTSAEAFVRLKALFDGSDYLRKRVKRINASHGEEGIELKPRKGEATNLAPRLRFIARSKHSGRGFSPQRVVWDEAQELSQLSLDALLPSMRAQWNPQSLYAGTVPGPDVNYPEHFTRLRDRGRGGKPLAGSTGEWVIVAGRLAWLEWSPVGSDDPKKAAKLDLDDRRHWWDANPGAGYRAGEGDSSFEEGLESDREAMSDDGFAREALSIWPNSSGTDGILDLEAWKKDGDKQAPPPAGRVVLYVDVSPDRKSASIGLASRAANGRIFVMVYTEPGTGWVVPKLSAIKEARRGKVAEIGLWANGQAGALIPDLIEAGLKFERITTAELGQACAAFITGVNGETDKDGDHVGGHRYVHVNQPELNRAVANATTRFSVEAELWDRRDRTIDICQLVAVSVAAFRFSKHFSYDPLDSVLPGRDDEED